MPGVRTGDDPVVALTVQDLHLHHTPSLARAVEPDWYAAMARVLAQINQLASKYSVPVISAGDVFHSWRQPPELISFALQRLPVLYSTWGQHDTIHHAPDQLKRSAYWTLVSASRIVDLPVGQPYPLGGDLTLWAWPWGVAIRPCTRAALTLNVAVCHKYVWAGVHKYPGAPDSDRAGALRPQLKGYDCAVFGDNHHPFCVGGRLFNGGCLIRRRSDERHLRPMVGLVRRSGMIEGVPLDVSEDRWADPEVVAEINTEGFDADEFLEGLAQLRFEGADIVAALRQYMKINHVSRDAKRLLELWADQVKA